MPFSSSIPAFIFYLVDGMMYLWSLVLNALLRKLFRQVFSSFSSFNWPTPVNCFSDDDRLTCSFLFLQNSSRQVPLHWLTSSPVIDPSVITIFHTFLDISLEVVLAFWWNLHTFLSLLSILPSFFFLFWCVLEISPASFSIF